MPENAEAVKPGVGGGPADVAGGQGQVPVERIGLASSRSATPGSSGSRSTRGCTRSARRALVEARTRVMGGSHQVAHEPLPLVIDCGGA